jgi:hypothetical protein
MVRCREETMLRLTMMMTLALMACSGTKDTDTADTSDTTDTTDTVVDTDDDTDVTVTCDVADPPGNLAISVPAFPNTTATVTWEAPDGCADTDRYEVAVGTTAGGTDVADWASAGTSLEWSAAATLTEDTDYFVSVRTVDTEGNVSTAVDTPAWRVWTPAELTGVALWLDATSGVYADTNCTNAAADDGVVACWVDRSANAHRAIRIVDIEGGPVLTGFIGIGIDRSPRFRATTWDGMPAIDFRGMRAMSIADADSLDLSEEFSVFWVNDFSGDANQDHYPINKEESYEIAHYLGGVSGAVWTTGPWSWRTSDRPAPGGRHVEGFRHLSDMQEFHHDGILDTVVSAPVTGTPAANTRDVVLGGRPLNTIRRYEALMTEMVVVDGTLTADQVRNVQGYLLSRWGIPMGSAYVPPTDSGDTGDTGSSR